MKESMKLSALWDDEETEQEHPLLLLVVEQNDNLFKLVENENEENYEMS